MRNPITDCLTPRAMQASVRAAWAVLGTHAALLPSSAVKPSRDGITAYACWPERAALDSGRSSAPTVPAMFRASPLNLRCAPRIPNARAVARGPSCCALTLRRRPRVTNPVGGALFIACRDESARTGAGVSSAVCVSTVLMPPSSDVPNTTGIGERKDVESQQGLVNA